MTDNRTCLPRSLLLLLLLLLPPLLPLQAEHEMGLPVSAEQIAQMREHVHDIDFDLARVKERELRHDVMAHIHTFGTACPKAMPIIHLGATSCFVGDNTDLIQMRESMCLLRRKMVKLLSIMRQFGECERVCVDRKSTRLNSSHRRKSRMPSSA